MNTHYAPLPTDVRAEPDASELDATWKLLPKATPEAGPVEDTDQAWLALQARLGLGDGRSTKVVDAEIPRAAGTSTLTPSRAWLRAAAVAGLLLAGSLGWYSVPVSTSAPIGEHLAVTLPDGSSVTLNAGSTLRHRRGFAFLPGLAASSRSVSLTGEAYFDVEASGRPFEVTTDAATVRVLGTRFNVRARGTGNESVHVHVEEGLVEVQATQGPRARVELGAGDAVRVPEDGSAPVPFGVRPERVASWRSGGLTAVDEELSSVIRELSLRYGVSITLSAPDAGSGRISVYYPRLPEIESALADLATQQNLRFRSTAQGWEVF